jgi:large subunit ribosomal protein L9
MKVFLTKDVEKVGMAGEIIKVTDGFARNFLFPRQLAIKVTADNESRFHHKIKQVEDRKEVIATKTSMLAERIAHMTITFARKMHDDGKLYGAINAADIVDALAKEGVSISKSQVIFDKSIKNKGTHEVIIQLTSRLQPLVKVAVVSE